VAAPTLNPGTTYEDGSVILVWSEPVSAVSGSSAALTVNIINRDVVLNFDNDDAALDYAGSVLTLTVPVAVYASDIVTLTVGADFVENGSSEGNALIEGELILNRSLVDYPTRTVNFTATVGGSVTLTSPDGSVDLTVKSANVELKG
jgi:hypothetical protein